MALVAAGCGRLGFDPLAVTAADAPVAQPLLPPGAQIWLQMETDPNVTVIDSAGNHTSFCNTMTPCPKRVPGVHGFGYQFSGQDITIQPRSDLSPSAGFTAAAWVRLDAYPASNVACFFAWPFTALNDTFVLGVDPTGKSVYDSEDSAGTSDSFTGLALPIGEWHHVAYVWTGSHKLGYFDGVVRGQATLGIGVDQLAALHVGADDMPPSFFLSGTLDDVVYYARTLSATEVAQLATP